MRPIRPVAAGIAGSLMLASALTGAGPIADRAGQSAGRPVAGAAALAPLVLISPDLRQVAGVHRAAPSTAFCEHQYKIACYLPQQLRQAYRLPELYSKGITGKGQTIVIVDSFGSPTVQHDLAVFDAVAHLPAPPAFRIIQPAGRVAPYRPDTSREGWAAETDLDVEYAHDIAPGAKILLVETPTSENEGRTGFPQIVRAEEYVINHHLGAVISQSFSASEQSFANRRRLLSLRDAYTDAAAKGVTVLAASGDSGAADVEFDGSTYFGYRVTSWPDSDPLVTGVGATQLHLNAAGHPTRAATVWNDTYNLATNKYIAGNDGPNPLASGGGRSAIFARPWYQRRVRGVVGGRRGVPDISMSGACNGAADMYQSFKGQPAGWYPTCGTSEATPIFAGIIALADQVAHHRLGLINPYLYRLSAIGARGIADVLSGSNTVSFRQGSKNRIYTVHGFSARRGYDLATGVGTVNAPAFVRELAFMANHRRWSLSRLKAALAHLS
jgi:subtilase family serine protease